MAEATTPTWEYVQQIIADNIDKADLAANAAERGLEELRQAISEIPFSAVDTGVSAVLAWSNLPDIGENVVPQWTATVTDPDVAEEPDYSDVELPTVTVNDVTVPAGVVGPTDDVVFSDPVGNTPVMGAKNTPDAPGEATTTPIGFAPPAALPDLDNMAALLAVETGTFSPDASLASALDVFATGAAATSNVSTDHPWGAAWENVAYSSMALRAENVRQQLSNILDDPATQGLPSSYWEQLATEAAARIARKKVGALRRAQNGGAASYWGLPTEAMLALTQVAEQDAAEELQAVEGEIVKKRTELVREAYFKAIDVLVDMERWMVGTALTVRRQAVDIFSALFGARVQMYNANLAQFKYVFDKVAMNIDALTTDNKTALEEWASRLRAMEALLEADKVTAQVFATEMEGYKIGRETHYRGIEAQVNLWSAKTDGAAKFEALKLDKIKVDLEFYKSVVDKVQSLAQATAALLSARSNALNARLEADKTSVQLDVAKNTTALERARLVQAAQQATGQLIVQLDSAKNDALLRNATLAQQAQETDAKIEVAQAQYVSDQTRTTLQALAASYVGIYQALLQVSDVNLSSGWSGSMSDSTTASKNQEKVWG